MVAEVLYARIAKELKDELDRISIESGMPLARVAEIVIARGLNMETQSPLHKVNELIAERFQIDGNAENQ